VAFDVRPGRSLGAADAARLSPVRIRSLVQDGLRVAIESSSLITGQKALSLEHVPGAGRAAVATEGDALVLPGEAGAGDIEASARRALGALSATLLDVRSLARHADGGLAPAFRRMPEISDRLERAVRSVDEALGESGYGQDSDFQRDLQQLLRQVNETARSVRLLADFLDRHPESLIRGRTDEAK